MRQLTPKASEAQYMRGFAGYRSVRQTEAGRVAFDQRREKNLATQAETLDERAVASDVSLCHVLQQTTTTTDHQEQSTT